METMINETYQITKSGTWIKWVLLKGRTGWFIILTMQGNKATDRNVYELKQFLSTTNKFGNSMAQKLQ